MDDYHEIDHLLYQVISQVLYFERDQYLRINPAALRTVASCGHRNSRTVRCRMVQVVLFGSGWEGKWLRLVFSGLASQRAAAGADGEAGRWMVESVMSAPW